MNLFHLVLLSFLNGAGGTAARTKGGFGGGADMTAQRRLALLKRQSALAFDDEQIVAILLGLRRL